MGSEKSQVSELCSEGVVPYRLKIMIEPTCEMPFLAANKVDSDYHKKTNVEGFLHWVERRVVPALRASYLGEKMVPSIDHAPYYQAWWPVRRAL